VIKIKSNILPSFIRGKNVVFFYGNIQKNTYSTIHHIFTWDDVLLLHHPLPLSAEEILSFPFVATPKTKALHHPLPSSHALLGYFNNPYIVLFLQYLYNDLERKALHHPPLISLALPPYFSNPDIVLFL
jgi:hypothetical protein